MDAEGGTVTLYFHPVLQDERDTLDLERALIREPRSQKQLVVTAKGTLPLAGGHVVQLDDLAELSTETGVLSILLHPEDLVGLPRKNRSGAPNRFDRPLTTLAQQRQRAGTVASGRNAEAEALRAMFSDRYPDASPPSLPKVRAFVTKFRAGQ